MNQSSSPFSARWFTAGPDVLWGQSSTYGMIPYELLPPLPAVTLDGSFEWLPALAPGRSPLHYDAEYGTGSDVSIPSLTAEARAAGFEMPEPFVRFVSTPELYERIPSITGCFLELSRSLIDDPSCSMGRLVRFLNDSQGSAYWYLYMTPNGEHCVLASAEWRDGTTDADADADADRGASSERFFWCGPDFESFLFRFWLEDEIWTRTKRNLPLTPEQREYLAAAVANRRLLPLPSTCLSF